MSAAEAATSTGWTRVVLDLVALSKPRLNALAVFAVAAGAWSVGGMPDRASFAWTLAGSFLVAAGSSSLNQWLERVPDGLMSRTASRPLPAGRIAPRDALLFGIALVVTGIVILAAAANPLTAGLGALSAITYVTLYTPLKRRTTLNTLVGTIPGALPPVMGVAAASGALRGEAAFLFGLLVAWQLPHFLSIAWLYRDDYRRAGYAMLPCVEGGEASTARQVVVQTMLCVIASLTATTFGLAGPAYFAVAAAVGLAFLALAVRFALRRDDASARWLLRGSLVHLPVVLVAFALDRASPDYS